MSSEVSVRSSWAISSSRAVNAVRQWRFAPGRMKGTPVDVVVQVGVEFRLR